MHRYQLHPKAQYRLQNPFQTTDKIAISKPKLSPAQQPASIDASTPCRRHRSVDTPRDSRGQLLLLQSSGHPREGDKTTQTPACEATAGRQSPEPSLAAPGSCKQRPYAIPMQNMYLITIPDFMKKVAA